MEGRDGEVSMDSRESLVAEAERAGSEMSGERDGRCWMCLLEDDGSQP